MVETFTPCTPAFGGTDGSKAASAAGRSDGRLKTADDFKQSSRRSPRKGLGNLNIAYMALMLGMFPH
jgi:hypothetical protein